MFSFTRLTFAAPLTASTPCRLVFSLTFSPSTRRPFSPPSRHALSPPQRTPSERIIVAVTHDAENYVVVDITGQTDTRAIRERILSKLHTPDDLHPSFAIYHTELGGFAIGGAPDNHLFIDCQHFGDDRGSLKFLAKHADAPTDDVDIPVMPPSNAPVPPLLPSFDLPDSENTSPHLQTRSPIQSLQRQAASRRGRQPSSSLPIVRRQVRRRSSGSATSDMSPVAPYPQGQGLLSQSSSPDRMSSSSSLTATRPHERRSSVTPTPSATRSPPSQQPYTPVCQQTGESFYPRPSRYVEGGFRVIPTQNGQVAIPRPGDGRLDRNERCDCQREKERERQEPVPIPRVARQPTGTIPVSAPGYPASMPPVVRATGEFGTSPRPAQGPLSSWGSQNMVPLARLADATPYYNRVTGNLNPAMPSPSELYRPPPLPQTSQSQPQIPQQHSTSTLPTRYTFGAGSGISGTFARRILDERTDDLHGGMEEQSVSPLSVNTSLLAPPPYERELESPSPSSVAGEVGQPSPMPLTPEPFHVELSKSRTASPSASDVSTSGYIGHTRDTDSDCNSTTVVSDTAEGTLKVDDYLAHVAAVARMIIPRNFAVQEDEDEDEDSDEDGGTLRQVPKQNSTPATSVSSRSGTCLIRRTATRPKNLTARIDSTRPASQTDSSPASTQDSANATFIAPTLPLEVRKKITANINASAGSESGSSGDTVSRPPLVQQPSHRGSQG
ncbi:hypothetical protein FRC08_009997 [Ceratobasidium sp. 394]|nr:hypothetical protein FRC08_009997 [Ceratobasidium sp. 394]